MRGRKPAPQALKLVNGTRKDRLNPDEPQLEVAEPRMPLHLNRRARAEWRRLVPGLLEAGVLTWDNSGVMADLCQAVADIAELVKDIRKHGRVDANGRRRPETIMLREARESRRKCEVELGLTPSARSRVKAVKAKKESNPFSNL